jgi:hypothetical protein
MGMPGRVWGAPLSRSCRAGLCASLRRGGGDGWEGSGTVPMLWFGSRVADLRCEVVLWVVVVVVVVIGIRHWDGAVVTDFQLVFGVPVYRARVGVGQGLAGVLEYAGRHLLARGANEGGLSYHAVDGATGNSWWGRRDVEAEGAGDILDTGDFEDGCCPRVPEDEGMGIHTLLFCVIGGEGLHRSYEGGIQV